MAKYKDENNYSSFETTNPFVNMIDGSLTNKKYITDVFTIDASLLTQGYLLLSKVPFDFNSISIDILGVGSQPVKNLTGLTDNLDVGFELDTVSKNRLYFKTASSFPLENDTHDLPDPPFLGGETIIVRYFSLS